MKKYSVVHIMNIKTVNRGFKTFTVSADGKGFYANEIGEKSQWAKIFGTGEYIAHRINSQTRYGNQYKRGWKSKPFVTLQDAVKAIEDHSQLSVMYF